MFYHVLYFHNVYFCCIYYMQYVSFANITKLSLLCVQPGAVQRRPPGHHLQDPGWPGGAGAGPRPRPGAGQRTQRAGRAGGAAGGGAGDPAGGGAQHLRRHARPLHPEARARQVPLKLPSRFKHQNKD